MNKVQIWLIATALTVVAILAAGWFFVVSPQRAQASDLRAQTVSEQGSTAAVRTALSVLQDQAKQLPAKEAQLAKFARQIPSSPALPSLIRALSGAAASAGVDLASVAPGPPAAFTPAVSAVPTTPSTKAPAAAATPATSALKSVTLTLRVTGTYAQLEQFVANLEGLQRVLLVGTLNVAPGSGTLKPTTTTSAAGCTAVPCILDLDLTAQVFTTAALAIAPTATATTPTAPTTTTTTPTAN